MPPGVGYPAPNLGLANSMPQTPLAPPMQAPGQVGPNNTGGIFGALGGGMDWMQMLQMMQQQQGQQGQGQQAPTHAPLMMPQMNAPQFQMSPLSGLFGLHRGV